MAKNPPYGGTIYTDSKIITAEDPTTLIRTQYLGQDDRVMYDRRFSGAFHFNAYCFYVTFDDCISTEIQVNPEFGSVEVAQAQVEKYAPVIGRLPTVLRGRVKTVWIHQGVAPFGGGNDNLLIHTGQADKYEEQGILEETLVHEAAHTSLEQHNEAEGWIAAQQADGTFISTYARDYPQREDVAESFLCWVSLRYRSRGVIPLNAGVIMDTIPNRIAYFDKQPFAMHPLTAIVGGTAAQRVSAAGALIEQNPFYTGAQRSPLEGQ